MALGPESAHLLRRLALHDDAALDLVFGEDSTGGDAFALTDKMHALVSLAALIATGSAETSYQKVISLAFSVGLEEDELVGTLLAVAPIVGTGRVNAAAAALVSALGYEDSAESG